MHIVHAALLALATGAPLLAQAPVPVMIGFKDSVDPAVLDRHGVVPTATIGALGVAVARVPAAAIQRLRREPAVDFVELDDVVTTEKPGGNPGKPGGGGGGGSPAQSVPPGIARVGGAVSAAGVVVSVIDTGIDLDHEDLGANIVGDVNFVRSGNPGDDDNGHGSHVAGTIAGVDNTVGVIGVAHDASLLAVKALDRRGSGSYSGIAAAITWSADNGANVVNMSLSGPSSSTALSNACSYAAGNNVLLVAAAGNDGDCDLSTHEIRYPASYATVICVGATTTNPMDALMCFSNSSPYVELSDPGYQILSTWKNGGYNTISGTSMATPHVAGCAAALWGGNANNVRSTLISYADDAGPAGRDNGWGYGVAEHVDND